MAGRTIDVAPADVERDRLLRRIAALEAELDRARSALAPTAAREAGRRFWLAFNEAQRPLTDPDEVVATATALLGRHLGASRVGYGETEPDGEHFRVTGDWHAPDETGIVGRYRFADFGEGMHAALSRGETLAIADVRCHPLTAEAAAAYEATGQLATLVVPLIRDGRLTGGFFVHGREPRAWTSDEINLTEDVAHRTWSELQQVRAEAALRESEQRLRATQEHAGIGIAETDRTGRYLRVNEAFCRITGYSREELLGLTSWDLTHPDHITGDSGRFAHQVAGELDSYSVEKRFLRKDGSIGWGLLTGSAVRGRQGEFLYAIRVLQDITERRATEEALRDQEERLRLAAEVTELGTWDFRPPTGERQWSDRFKAILGLPPSAEAVNETMEARLHPEDREMVLSRYAAAFDPASGGRFDAEFRILRADDGRERWVRDTGRVYFDEEGLPCRAIGTLHDITARKQAEADLRDSEERYRRLVELSPDAVIVDVDSIIVYTNRAALDLFGAVDPDELTGRSTLDLVAPEQREQVRERIRRLRDTGGANPPLEQRWTRLDGRMIDLEVSSASVPWGLGRANQVVLRDIRARKQAEERQRLLLHELNHRVKNTLATVQSLAVQTARTTETREAFLEALLARLLALSATHNLLTEGAWDSASLEDLLLTELAPYAGNEPGRIVIAGPALTLYPRVVLALGMVFHELATNAAKYGALSGPAGQLHIGWTVTPGDAAGPRLAVTWEERGGPPVTPPARRGFGSRLIEHTMQAELGGTIRLDYRPDGLHCRIDVELPMERGDFPAT